MLKIIIENNYLNTHFLTRFVFIYFFTMKYWESLIFHISLVYLASLFFFFLICSFGFLERKQNLKKASPLTFVAFM